MPINQTGFITPLFPPVESAFNKPIGTLLEITRQRYDALYQNIDDVQRSFIRPHLAATRLARAVFHADKQTQTDSDSCCCGGRTRNRAEVLQDVMQKINLRRAQNGEKLLEFKPIPSTSFFPPR